MNQDQINRHMIYEHLDAEIWQIVNRKQLKKAISEFTHERLLHPQQKNGEKSVYILYADTPSVYYQFEAKILALDHWQIKEDSLLKIKKNKEEPLDLLSFIVEFQQQLMISDKVLPTYLEELTSTLVSQAYKCQYQELDAKALVTGDFQQVEHAMIEGHPCFVANSGRIGFSGVDYRKFAPEAQQPFSIIWLAGHKDNTHYAAIEDLPYKQLLKQELGEALLADFNKELEDKGLSPTDFIFIPVHPWQWFNKLLLVFAKDIAQQKLVYLGESANQYLAQQSIRTLYNRDEPTKFYTKTALSIINMGFMRGLSPYYMKNTPAITTWINDLLEPDAYLQDCGFKMLGEVATVGYTNQHYDQLGASCPYNKMLSALWRESPMLKKKPNQRLMTMAAFLHVDYNGGAFLPQLIQASGLSVKEWLKAYLNCYFSSLLHCFFKYELVFMPHGENIIMILEDNVPVGIFMKDITEEILLYNKEIDLPEQVQRILVETTDEMKLLSLFTDVFDCYFRFMSAILNEHTAFSEASFWELVADCISDYQEAHPEYEEKYERYDLFVLEFKRCCLNRLQLGNNKQMLDLADPVNSLKFSGMLLNPIAVFKPELNVVD
ncbi:IucA/IucC family protein [Aureispira anguillae]|uniref:IucA/IucC family siderophore biosynthesis protein n=1 Tax=Aureispira anguillae TaxID=2864201 RepID=A0A915YDQ5_9BACT|nr:IucA/IucC family siderophore biosynthesis protein [Aureispira anguillae]BDS11219.1 IucA/IucC family siderophore biosynthesis protein [Aureispira anguillae]